MDGSAESEVTLVDIKFSNHIANLADNGDFHANDMGIDLGAAATFGSTCSLLGIDDQEMDLSLDRLSSARLSSDRASRPLQDDQRNTSLKSLKALKSSRVSQNLGSPAKDPDK